MKRVTRSTAIAFAAALAAFLALCALFSGAPDDAGLLACLDPVSAVDGLAFALAFGSGMPEQIATPVAVATLALAPLAVFAGARRVLRRCDR